MVQGTFPVKDIFGGQKIVSGLTRCLLIRMENIIAHTRPETLFCPPKMSFTGNVPWTIQLLNFDLKKIVLTDFIARNFSRLKKNFCI